MNRGERLALGRALARPVLRQPERAVVGLLADRASPADWQRLTDMWLAQRVGPWLHGHAAELGLPLPAADAERLAAQWLDSLQRNLACDQLRRHLAPVLQGTHAPLLLLKGSTIEATAYGGELVRPSVDLDVLARPGHAVESALRALNLQPAGPRRGHEQTWVWPHAAVALDVHFALADPRRHPPLARDDVLAGLFADAVTSAEGELRLADVDQSAHLLVHLGPGLYGDWRHLADLGQWWRRVEPADDAVAARLARWQAKAVARTALEALAWFDPSLSMAPLSARLGAPGWRARGFGQLARAWLQVSSPPWPRWFEAIGFLAQYG